MAHYQNLIRVATNYVRLLLSVVTGLLVARVLLTQGGVSAFSFYAFVTVGLGFGVMLRETIRIAVLPDLGVILDNDGDLSPFFSNLLFVCIILGAFIGIGVFSLGSHVGDIYKSVIDIGGFHFLMARSVMSFITTLFVPYYCLLLAQQQFVVSNIFVLIERFADLAAVVVLVLTFEELGNIPRLSAFGLSSLISLVIFCSIFFIFVRKIGKGSSEIMNVSLRLLEYSRIKKILYAFRYPLLAVLALNLFVRFDVSFSAEYFGAMVVAAFGLAIQISGLLRQLCNGVANGLDAVFSRSNVEWSKNRSNKIIDHNIRLQCFVVGHLTVFLVFYSKWIFTIWLGDSVSEEMLHLASYITIFITIGLGSRGVSECWIAFLNGRGFSKNYVWGLLLAAVLNILVLVVFGGVGKESHLLNVMLVFFVICHVISYLVYVPLKYCTLVGLSYRHLVRSLAANLIFPGLSFVACAFAIYFEFTIIVPVVLILSVGVDTLLLYRTKK